MKYIFFLSLMWMMFSCGEASSPSAPAEPPAHTDTLSGDSTKVSASYLCPCGHCGFEGSSSPGDCPKCGMELEKVKP
ncbi:MAG: hypothetical protein IT233_04855 [Bacteroidia bacterium]|nr:hypothetical protein [Bacteroidia bacterium]